MKTTKLTEQDLIAPALYLLATETEPMGTAILAAKLEGLLKPAGDSLDLVDDGKETRFLRTVRNLRSHATLEKKGLAIHTGLRKGAFQLTDKGLDLAHRIHRAVESRASGASMARKATVLKNMVLV